MKDLVIYEKQTRLIISIITNYKESDDRIFILNQNVDTYLVDSNKQYILTDEQTGLIKFINPDSKILYMDDYREANKIKW